MLYRASKKVVGGKLVRVEVECEGELIRRVKITGDFFLHPEERLSQLEKSLVGLSVQASAEDFNQSLVVCVKQVGDTTLYGVSLQDIAQTVADALKS